MKNFSNKRLTASEARNVEGAKLCGSNELPTFATIPGSIFTVFGNCTVANQLCVSASAVPLIGDSVFGNGSYNGTCRITSGGTLVRCYYTPN